MTRILTREGINRMVGNSRSAQGSQSSRGGGGGGGQAVSLANLTDVAISTPIDGGSVLTFDETAGKWVAGPGYATETWVSQNYISIAFFSRLFQAHGTENNQQTDIDPNDMDSTITSIEAMFGFWTEQYLSALGNSGGGSVSLTLANMGDVSLNNLADGQVLTYNATLGKWVNANPQGGVTSLSSLTDVTLTTPSANQVLLYDGTTSKWINSGLKTINGQPIYGTGNIEVGGGASGNYLPLSGGTLINAGFAQQLTIKRDAPYDSVIRYTNSNGTLGYIGITSNKIPFFYSITGTSRYFVFEDTTNVFLPLTGGTLTGRLTINASVADVLVLNRTSASSVVRMDMAQGGTVYGNIGLDTSHNIILRTTSGGTHTVRLQINTNGNVGIGTTSPNYKLHVNGTLGAGNTSVANLESEGYVSALSDIRKKEVVEYMEGLTIEQIASMPIIKFLWKDRPEEGLQVGSVAQEWEKILPQSVHTTRKGFLSFAESRAALVGTISNSRKLVDHEKRIAELERENKELKLKLNIA